MIVSRPDNEAIFHAARDIPYPDRRREYVREACGHDEARIAHIEALLAAADGPDSLLDDPAVRRHVEGMLAVYPQLGAFLETPAVDGDPWATRSDDTPVQGLAAALDSAAGQRLRAGRFQLGEELARGGMGVVYRARDDSLGRDVAVKVLNQRYRVDPLVGQRFLDEARITAQLQHPGIPPVFEVGRLSDDRPYLAMKLIKGRTLQDLLKERSDPAEGRGHFLAVFQQICQAVAYAHSKHILHRDLKPANVMVGAFGEVQVMDWGLAKLLETGSGAAHELAAGTETTCGTVIQTAREPDSATAAGSMLGTPAYMAPEQAGGELHRIDERTDVFGLGGILCVILTGEPPYTSKSGEDVRLMAVRGTLADAHLRLEQCGADAKLVELCRQCLSPEREARPRDAGAVAATIAGYLAGVEERARQAELERAAAEARAAEQRKRRRVQLGAAAVIAGVLLLGIAISTWQAIRASEAEILADDRLEAEKEASSAEAQQRQLANDEKKRAETNLRKAREAVDKLFTEVAEKLAGQPHMEQIRRRLLEDALEFYQGFLKQKGTDPEMRHETARAYRRVGDIQEHLGNGPQAEAAQREGVALFEKLVTDFPGVPIYREDLIACRALLGWRMLWVPKPEEAIELRRRDLADWEKLAADFPTVPRYQQRIAYAHTDLANALNYPGRRYPEAENHYRQALTAWKKYQASFPKMPADRFGLAHSHMYLGAFLLGKGRFVEAGPELREGLALSKQLVVDNPGDFGLKLDLARALRYFGHWLRRTGKTHEAMKHCQEAIDIYEKHRNSFPDDAEALDKLGGSYGDVSAALLLLGRTEEAEAARRSSVAMYSKLVADHPGVNPYPNNLGRGQFHLGLLLYYNKNEQDAADVFRAARDVLEKLAKDRPGEPDHQIALGWLLANCPAPQFRDPGRAIELAKRALQRNPLDKGNWHLFGVANYRAGNWKGALEATQKSMELDNGGDGGQWIVLAVAHWQLGDKDEARKWYDKAAAWLKKSWPGDLQYHFAQREAAALLGVQERPAAKHKGKTPEQKDEPR